MRWYAASTQPNRERFAVEQLRNQDFEVFLPAMRRRVRHARQTSEVLRAYFPGYVFVALEPDHRPWRSVNGTIGVRRLVCSGDRPAPLPPGFVETLQQSADADGVISFRDDLDVGDRVRVMHGPFADLVGRVSTLAAPDRVRVLLDLMAHGVPVELPSAYCQKAG